jgi:hypothetical protein
VAFRKANTFVSGSRVQMSASISDRMIKEQHTSVSVFSKGISNVSNGLRIPFLSRLLASRYRSKDLAFVRGCNMAFWKKDLISVNGYNEAIVGWGREDSELAIRLLNFGVGKRIYKFGAVAYHLYHKETLRAKLDKNEGILQQTITKRVTKCEKGLADHLSEN